VKRGNEERRKLPRFRITSVGGSIDAPFEAEVINLSMAGALVEHQGALRVGSQCTLVLPVAGGTVGIRCQVVHSSVDHRAKAPAGEGLLFYRTGLEFLEVSAEAENILATLIRSYGEAKGA
jgi:hypothetical protein